VGDNGFRGVLEKKRPPLLGKERAKKRKDVKKKIARKGTESLCRIVKTPKEDAEPPTQAQERFDNVPARNLGKAGEKIDRHEVTVNPRGGGGKERNSRITEKGE